MADFGFAPVGRLHRDHRDHRTVVVDRRAAAAAGVHRAVDLVKVALVGVHPGADCPAGDGISQDDVGLAEGRIADDHHLFPLFEYVIGDDRNRRLVRFYLQQAEVANGVFEQHAARPALDQAGCREVALDLVNIGAFDDVGIRGDEILRDDEPGAGAERVLNDANRFLAAADRLGQLFERDRGGGRR